MAAMIFRIDGQCIFAGDDPIFKGMYQARKPHRPFHSLNQLPRFASAFRGAQPFGLCPRSLNCPLENFWEATALLS